MKEKIQSAVKANVMMCSPIFLTDVFREPAQLEIIGLKAFLICYTNYGSYYCNIAISMEGKSHNLLAYFMTRQRNTAYEG